MRRPGDRPAKPSATARATSSGSADTRSPTIESGGGNLRAADGSAAVREGWGLYGSGRLDEARRVIMPQAARSPDDPEAAYLLGMIFKAQGDVNLAVRAFAAARQTAGEVPDRIRAEMLQRLAQANIDLLIRQPADKGEGRR